MMGTRTAQFPLMPPFMVNFSASTRRACLPASYNLPETSGGVRNMDANIADQLKERLAFFNMAGDEEFYP